MRRTPALSVFKPNGWHLMDGLDGQIYRGGTAIDGVVEILQRQLMDGIQGERDKALFACCDLLSRVRDDMFHIANTHEESELEGF